MLIDVHLGEEDGFQLARRIAGLDREGFPRVILISSYPEDDLDEALPTGPAIEFVSKTNLSASAIRNALDLPPEDQTAGENDCENSLGRLGDFRSHGLPDGECA